MCVQICQIIVLGNLPKEYFSEILNVWLKFLKHESSFEYVLIKVRSGVLGLTFSNFAMHGVQVNLTIFACPLKN